jgi:uncharacterized protein (DUF486 family)
MSYLDYIPIISSNPSINAAILTIAPGVLYTAAAYGHLFLKGASLTTSTLVSVFFAILEYIIRVPIIKYSSDVAGWSNGTLQAVWVVITLLLGYASDKFMPVKK